jgi:acyl-CoA synthetase (AMP-forming)/AMP-acid ligase II
MLTLTSVLQRTLRLHGERPAVLDSEQNFTWAQFGDRVARSAGVLRSLGIARGARCGILCRNGCRNNELMHAGY